MGDNSKNEDPKSLKTIVKKMAESSSMHGLPKIVSSRQMPIKILWCLLFLGTTGVLVYQLYGLFTEYYSFPIKTTVSLDFNALRFPAVSFCNMNPVRKSMLQNASQELNDIINPKLKKKKTADGTGVNGARKKRAAGNPSSSYNYYSSLEPTSSSVVSAEISTTGIIDSVIQSSPITPELLPTSSVNIITISSSVALESASSAIPTSTVSVSASYGSESYLSDSYASSSYDSSSYDYYYTEGYWDWWYYDTNTNYWSDYSWSDYSWGSNDWSASWDPYWDYDYGDSVFSWQQYFLDDVRAPKDKWQERIDNFKLVFRNQSLETRELVGHDASDLVYAATFAKKIRNPKNFTRFTNMDYGNCYTMTSPKYVAWSSGPAHGVQLTLNLEMDEYIKNFATGYGIRLVLHEPGTFPFPNEEGLTLSPGYETSIGLRMVRIKRLSDPHGQCSDGHEFWEKYKIRYSVSACMQFCMTRFIIQNCNCIPPDSADIDLGVTAERICNETKFSDKACVYEVTSKFDDGSANCDCISPCNEVMYTKTISGRRWPNDDYLTNVLMTDLCKRNMTSMDIPCGYYRNGTFSKVAPDYRYNFLRVVIYYEDLNYEKITQEPLYEATRFLSDIGGALGLFVGASVLSVVELFQLVVEIVLLFRTSTKTGVTTVPSKTVLSRENTINYAKDSEFKKRYSISDMPNYVSTKT